MIPLLDPKNSKASEGQRHPPFLLTESYLRRIFNPSAFVTQILKHRSLSDLMHSSTVDMTLVSLDVVTVPFQVLATSNGASTLPELLGGKLLLQWRPDSKAVVQIQEPACKHIVTICNNDHFLSPKQCAFYDILCAICRNVAEMDLHALGGELLKFPGFGWSNWNRSNRGGTRQCHAEIISTRDLQRAVDFVSGVVSWTQNRFAELENSLDVACV